MITCDECKFISWSEYGPRVRCYCRENLREKFSPISGVYSIVKDDKFHEEANKDGNCLWFEPKKQKWWKKKKVYNNERFVSNNTEEFLAFMRSNYPEIVVEYMMMPKKELETKIHKVKPTPTPSVGVKRI